MDATTVLLEDQVTAEVNTWVLPSLKVPVATNCSVSPRAMDGAPGSLRARQGGRSDGQRRAGRLTEGGAMAARCRRRWPALLPAALEMVATEVIDEPQVPARSKCSRQNSRSP
jgi:hypothetical protein